jgi:hypothetical protein
MVKLIQKLEWKINQTSILKLLFYVTRNNNSERYNYFGIRGHTVLFAKGFYKCRTFKKLAGLLIWILLKSSSLRCHIYIHRHLCAIYIFIYLFIYLCVCKELHVLTEQVSWSDNNLDLHSGGASLEFRLPEIVVVLSPSWLVPRLGHDCSLPDPFQFIIH